MNQTEITKFYSIERWSHYTEVPEIGSITPDMEMETIPAFTTSVGHLCSIVQWVDNSTGDGWEERTFTVFE